MTTTDLPVPVAVEAVSHAVIDALLAPRRTRLHRRAPRTKGTHQLRRSIQCGKARPVQMLLQVAADDLADGVPLPEVEEPFRELVEAVRTLAIACAPPTGPHLVAFMRRESAAEAELRACELEVAAAPDALPLLSRLARALAHRDSAAATLGAAVRAKRLALIAHRGPGPALRTA